MADQRSKIEFAADVTRLDEVRCEITRLCREWGVDDLTTLRFVLAIDEASANAIEHGRLGDGATIEIGVGLRGHELTARIVDRGPAFDPTQGNDFDPVSVTRRKRGFGLYLMSLIARTIEYERTASDENSLTVTIPVH